MSPPIPPGRRGDLSFEVSEPAAYRRDVPQAQVHLLDTAAEEIALLVRAFLS